MEREEDFFSFYQYMLEVRNKPDTGTFLYLCYYKPPYVLGITCPKMQFKYYTNTIISSLKY